MADIIIIGAGIAGLAAAISLSKAGHEVTLYERRKKVDAISASSGAGLILWSNGCEVLDKLGILNDIHSISGKIENFKIFNHHGMELEQFSIQEIERNAGFPCCPVLYKELHAVLLDHVQRLGCHLIYNANVQSIYEPLDAALAQVQFDNNKLISGDIIVGADGRMRSIVREYVVGDNKPIYQNYVNWVGFIESKSLLIHSENVADYRGVGKRFGIVPIGKDKAYWAGCQALPSGLGVPEEGNKNKLVCLFEKWPEPIIDVIHATAEKNIKRIEAYDLDPAENWVHNNVVLLGDAAHASLPTSGQGACQAIIDAFTLTESLSKYSDVGDALQDYQRIRIPITTKITCKARDLASKIFGS